MAQRNPSNPAPVRALTRTREILPYWSRSTAGSRCAQSILFQTAILGAASAPISPSTLSRSRSEEHTSELQSLTNLVCRLLLEKKKKKLQQTKDTNIK